MDPITAYSASAYTPARRPVAVKPSESAAPFTPDARGRLSEITARKPDYLQAKPEQAKNRETDEQVTRQRVQDKQMGTLFDLRA